MIDETEVVVFFKQKTAYEMRISDWSSDVGSSDLTTCFNLLTKFLQPTAGSIVYKGQDITRLAPAEITRLGLARSFQISAVFPHMSALENVRVALQRRCGESFDFWRSETVLRDRKSTRLNSSH